MVLRLGTIVAPPPEQRAPPMPALPATTPTALVTRSRRRGWRGVRRRAVVSRGGRARE